MREISSRIHRLKHDIMLLLETRVKVSKSKRIRDQLNLYDNYLDNYDRHANGRIWITWNDAKLDIKLVHSTGHAMCCGVYDEFGVFKFWLTGVYAQNHLDQRRIL